MSSYGWHFSKKMFDWAVSKMYKTEGNKKVKIEPLCKEIVDSMLKQYGIILENNVGYDAAYVANMCKADFLGKSVKGEAGLVQYIKDTIDDPDGYEGMVFTRFFADCIGSGTPVYWEDML